MIGTTRTVTRYGLLAGLVLGLAWVVKTLIKTAVLVSCRYVVGLPLDGQRTTDATFSDDGTQSIGRPSFWGRREPTRWALMAGWKRAAIRLVVPAVLLATAAAWLRWPTGTRWTLTIFAGAVLGYAGWWMFERARRRHHMTRYLAPLHNVLGAQLGIDEKWRPTDWLDVPVDFRADHAVIEIKLPGGFYAGADDSEGVGRRTAVGARGVVDGIVCEKLGLSRSDLEATYSMVGAEPTVIYRHVQRPPETVTVDMVREAVGAAADSAPVIGLGRQGKVVSIDLDTESPHVLLSMGTGAGKSMFTRGQLAQQLHNGARVVVLDVKRTSQRWCRDHPHVRYARDPEDIHDELLALQCECDRRNRLIDDVGPDADVGPRVIVVAEETNAMITRLIRYWASVRTKDDPKASPALDALADLMFMGREPMIHMIGIAQLGTARALGGNEARENFSTRVLGRYTQNAWRMLVPEVSPIPKSSKRRGRVQVVLAGDVYETQTTKWDLAEAREWAWGCFAEGLNVSMSPIPRNLFFRGETVGTVPDLSQSERESVKTSTREIANRGHLSVVPDPAATAVLDGDIGVSSAPVDVEELVTLRQAVDRGIVTVSDDPKRAMMILRKARSRDPEFPAPAGERGRAHLFRPSELQRWQRNRPKSESA
ncbi:MAG: hypothetical protein GEU93_16765 [Propionibacteriales bacterium]|nr:hypothetical protein [Propionibacteriales bacterium]MPZ67450.1 hypothetical protein [Pseudonocardiaceae bacterium]